jgi:cell division protein FtsB
MTDEKHEVESLSEDDLLAQDVLVERARRPWGLLIAGVLFLALWVWREVGIRVAREDAISQQAEINRLTQENETLTQELERVSGELAALSSGAARTIELKGQPAAPEASAKVLLDPGRNRAVIFFYKLPRNPRDKNYQIWMTVDERPVSGGVFDVSRRGSAAVVVENVPRPQAVAFSVTLEQKGGAEQPNSISYLSSKVQ